MANKKKPKKEKPAKAPAGGKAPKSNATQRYLAIAEIRDNLVTLRDGTMRGVILVSSINFALKSEDEQKGIIQAYMQFLNTFEFPTQIVIQSRKLNIDDYLTKLDQLAKEQTNDLLKIQTTEYRQFVLELIEMSAIMSKRFYVVVPYSPIGEKIAKKSFLDRVREIFSPTDIIRISQDKFIDYTISGLEGMSLKAIQLDTQSLIELYYNSYNPDTYENQKIVEVGKIDLE